MAQLPEKVNPPIEQEYDQFVLNGGLDLTSPKLLVEKGTLLDCSNREVVDLIGYKTIDGFDRFDGQAIAGTEFWYISASSVGGTFATDFAAGELLITTSLDANKVFGKSVGTATINSNPSIVYIRLDETYEPQIGDNVATYNDTGLTFSNLLKPAKWSSQSSEDASEVVTSYNTYNATLRSRVGSILPEVYLGQPAVVDGLHWFNDRLYAVSTDITLNFEQTDGTDIIYPNYILDKSPSVFKLRVLDVQVLSGSFAGGDATGIIQAELQTGSIDVDPLEEYSGVTVTAPSGIGTQLTLTGFSQDANGNIPQYASFWQAKSEQQSIDEHNGVTNIGWNRIDHGWEFGFEEGYASSGDLVKVSRSRDNNFSYSTSSVADNFPQEAYNGMNVIGSAFAPNSRQPLGQLVELGTPGWKSSASSSVFATDEALNTAIGATGGTTAYANIWYSYTAQLGNKLYARDKDVLGPANVGSIGTSIGSEAVPAVGAVTLDSDWYSTQARAPILLKNFSAAAVQIPEGAVISGINVAVAYTSRHWAAGRFQYGRITNTTFRDNILTAVNNITGFAAQVVEVGTATDSTSYGQQQFTALTLETDTADYTVGSSGSASSGSQTHEMAQTAALTGLTTNIGGSGNTFGLKDLSREFWINEDIGIAVYGQIIASPAFASNVHLYTPSGTATIPEVIEGQIRLNVDSIKVTFYYTVPSARYFVGDGASPTPNVCSIDVVYTLTTDGTWESRTAEGTIQGTNLDPDLSGAKLRIATGDKLYLTLADAVADASFANGTSIANVTSNMTYNGLPSFQKLLNAKSRYEFITANFYADESWDGIYGVSGAGRAFSLYTYDADDDGTNENYFINITTNTEDTTGDTPRHIAFHHNALALSMPSGVVRLSVQGEPENFDGILGAAEIGVGDKVTGLLSMKGYTLGVFCENSIWGIAGTDADNYSTQVLAPYTGAIEYTIVDMGIPVYCDSRGISTLEQSEKYGNFLGQRLSAKVSPFIIPRMVRDNGDFTGTGVVCAIPVRSKNQYRLFFRDGVCLVMTMNPDGTPSFTKSNYYVDQDEFAETTFYVVPFAWSSQTDDKGRERIHFSHYSPKSGIGAQSGAFVYEMDVGWSFAGNFIPAFYTVNWFNRNPFLFSTIRNLRIDGLTKGYSSCKVYCAKDYDTTFSTNGVDISLPRSTASAYSLDFFPTSNMAHIAERGRSLSIKVVNEIPSGETITDPIPPDIHQIGLIQYGPGGKKDA